MLHYVIMFLVVIFSQAYIFLGGRTTKEGPLLTSIYFIILTALECLVGAMVAAILLSCALAFVPSDIRMVSDAQVELAWIEPGARYSETKNDDGPPLYSTTTTTIRQDRWYYLKKNGKYTSIPADKTTVLEDDRSDIVLIRTRKYRVYPDWVRYWLMTPCECVVDEGEYSFTVFVPRGYSYVR